MSSTQNNEKLEDISVDLIDKHPNNPRIHFTESEMEKLADSIDSQGILVPILVYRNEGRFILVDGERRWRTSKKLGLKVIPAVISDPKSEKDHLIQMFNIHMVREPWNSMPTAWALERLIEELGSSDNDALHEASGLPVDQIRRLKHALELPKEYQKLINDETIPLNFFWELKKNVIDPLTKQRPGIWNSFGEGDVVKSFVNKRMAGTLTDTVSLRKVRPIISVAAEEAGSPEDESELDATIKNLISNVNTTIESAYEDTVEMAVEADKLANKSANIVKSYQRLWEKTTTKGERNELRQLGLQLIAGIESIIS